MIGTTLGNRYHLVRQLGTGGMARVFLAVDTRLGSNVAIKVLHPQFAEEKAYIERFAREAKMAGVLDNPHIVKILEYGQDREHHYLVIEYIDGQDIRKVIESEGPLAAERVIDIADQVAEALQHAYERGIIHRDIKSPNLLLTRDGVIKVLDFGIARSRALPSLTGSGFIGSPHYISPEQAMGERADIRSDIYSLGVVLYEMLSGQLPYVADTPWSVINAHITSQPTPLRQLRPDIPPAVERLVERTMAKNPLDRFQSPAELRAAIAAVKARKSLPRVAYHPNPELANLLAEIYANAQWAAEHQRWPTALNLFTQILGLAPNYRDAAARAEQAATRVKLDALYNQAARQIQALDWPAAQDTLSQVLALDSSYRDARELISMVQRELAAGPGKMAKRAALPASKGVVVGEYDAFRRLNVAVAPARPALLIPGALARGKPHRMLFYRRLWDYTSPWAGVVALFSAAVLWFRALEYPYSLVFGLSILACLAGALLTWAMWQRAIVQCLEDRLLVRFPFYAMEVAYHAIKGTRLAPLEWVMDPRQGSLLEHGFLKPLLGKTAIVVQLTEIPNPNRWQRLTSGGLQLTSEGVALLVEDWMRLRREIDDRLLALKAPALFQGDGQEP
jgi:hypothetical protein